MPVRQPCCENAASGVVALHHRFALRGRPYRGHIFRINARHHDGGRVAGIRFGEGHAQPDTAAPNAGTDRVAERACIGIGSDIVCENHRGYAGCVSAARLRRHRPGRIRSVIDLELIALEIEQRVGRGHSVRIHDIVTVGYIQR